MKKVKNNAFAELNKKSLKFLKILNPWNHKYNKPIENKYLCIILVRNECDPIKIVNGFYNGKNFISESNLNFDHENIYEVKYWAYKKDIFI